MLLLVMETYSSFDVIKNCFELTTFETAQTSINMNKFLSYSKCSKMSIILLVL